MVSLPVDFIEVFVNRPVPMTTAEYETQKAVIGEHAAILHEAGENITQDIKSEKRGKEAKELKRREDDFRKDVLILEMHYTRLEDGYRRHGGNYIKQVAFLVVGLLSYVIDI